MENVKKKFKPLRIYEEQYPQLEELTRYYKRSKASMVSWLIIQELKRVERRKQRERERGEDDGQRDSDTRTHD